MSSTVHDHLRDQVQNKLPRGTAVLVIVILSLICWIAVIEVFMAILKMFK